MCAENGASPAATCSAAYPSRSPKAISGPSILVEPLERQDITARAGEEQARSPLSCALLASAAARRVVRADVGVLAAKNHGVTSEVNDDGEDLSVSSGELEHHEFVVKRLVRVPAEDRPHRHRSARVG